MAARTATKGQGLDNPRILVVDDEESIRHVLQRVLEMKDCDVRQAESAEEALTRFEDWEPDVALIDIVLPGMNGIQLLSEIKQVSADTEVLVMTSNASAETALQAIRRGAYDYLQKPFANLGEVWSHVQRALEKRSLTLKNRDLLRKQHDRNEELSSAVTLATGEDDDVSNIDFESMSEVLENFLSVVVHELEVDRASLMLLDRESGQLRIGASKGLDGIDVDDIRVPLGEGIAGQVALTGETFLVRDAATDDRLEPGGGSELSNSFISAPITFSVPIRSERDVFGVINVTNRKNGEPFDSDDVAFLSGLAGQLGIVIEGARHSDQLQKAYQSLKSTQEQLVFSERIKAVGQMAAGVAHDFNNALAIILARAQFCLRQFDDANPDVEKLRANLETIVKTSLQGAQTIKRIQDYTRIRKDAPKTPVDLNAVVRDALEIARPKWDDEARARGLHVEIKTELQQVANVSGNVYELTQVVGNLIFNAVEAMPEGGRLEFRTFDEGDSVILEVRDTGTGMDDETRKRLFEPFYTTKATGQGLGTSIIFGIVSRHNGEVTVDSAPGEGATFRVMLPATHAETDLVEVQAKPVETPVRNVRVLLVDDDDMVRETYVEALQAEGHEVVPAESGFQAIEICRETTFDLVITDLSMSGMSGLELATAVKDLDAGLPIILFSGWAAQEIEEKVKDAGVDRILVKPCLIEDLLTAVQDTVRRPAEAQAVGGKRGAP